MKHSFILLLTGLLLAGCATKSTVDSRRSERAAAYASLPPEQRELVDQGHIKVGMTTDAVYIAWGEPAQIVERENERERATTWLYEGGWMQENRYWSYRQRSGGRELYLERYPLNDYQPRTYVRAQLRFVEGRLKEWQTLPQPAD